MYPLNQTEFYTMPYPVFDNSTPLMLNGTINGSTTVSLATKGYITVVAEVRGMDDLLLGMDAIIIILTILLGLEIWRHYRETWGGKKNF